MNPKLLPARPRDDTAGWERTLLAFLAEKERRSGSHRTVESYSRMLWPFFARAGSPETITPAHALAWAHGVGASGREPSAATVGARIACLSSFYRFLIRMNVLTANPCDALERPSTAADLRPHRPPTRGGDRPHGGRPQPRGRDSPWGSETRIPSRSEAMVLVDEPIEQIPPTDITRVDWAGDRDRD